MCVGWVRWADRGGSEQAFEALRMTGASRFAIINMANPSPSLLAREQAFADVAAASDSASTIVRAGHSNYAGGQEAARRLLAQEGAPEAAFCVNDLMAFGALDHFCSVRLSLPRPISLVGFPSLP